MLKWFVLSAVVTLLLLTGQNAGAIAPHYVSDESLAKYPVIVVAKWDQAPFKPHHRYRGSNVVTAIESFTELNILRVIKGDLKPGTNKLMSGWGIAWSQDGRRLTSGTSTELAGDVKSVTEPNIWFLRRARSWDAADKTQYLSVANYREIQPMVLESYFGALASAQPAREVPLLLNSTNTEVLRRVLQYVCGGVWPWPRDSDFERKLLGRTQGKSLPEHSKAVAAVIERRELNEVRAMATSVYAELEGARCVQYVRGLLTDADAEVRTMAVAVLAHHKDSAAVDRINRTVTGKEPGWIACKIVEAISQWSEPRLVPALATFLESGKLAYQIGDDLGIPALKSREALHRITGHWFPYDVQASLGAWKEAEQISDRDKRRELLARILPGDSNPLRAEVVGDGSTNAACKVSNKSKQNVLLAILPTWAEQRWPGGSSGARVRSVDQKGSERFVRLKPGESTQFDLQLDKKFIMADPASKRLTIRYNQDANDGGAMAWIGALDAVFGAAWTGERKVENFEETWPNGNLKAKGQKVNGEKQGEWHYFNEKGDRIRVDHYNDGNGSGPCNPDHPDNKGAGRRR